MRDAFIYFSLRKNWDKTRFLSKTSTRIKNIIGAAEKYLTRNILSFEILFIDSPFKRLKLTNA